MGNAIGVRLALFEPDIPQNTGAILRLAACLAVPVDIIEPCGFVLDDRRLRRVGLDYLEAVTLTRHRSWQAYQAERQTNAAGGRLLLLTSSGDLPYHRFIFEPGDTLLLGRESAGVPPPVHEAADARLRVPMQPGLRSLNLVVAAAMVLGEALRQTERFPISLPDESVCP